ncbi:MAG: DUF4234 domain-containing protein [Deltaproteobacteria bacterium]
MDKPELLEFRAGIAKYIILTIITLGIFNLYWQYRQMKFVNLLAGEKKFSFPWWLFLTIITFGIYHIYHEYVVGREIASLQDKLGIPRNSDLAIISVLLSIFGLTIVTDAIQQREINAMIDKISG